MKTEILLNTKKQNGLVINRSDSRYQQLLASITDFVYTGRLTGGVPTLLPHGPGCEAVTGYTVEEFQAEPQLYFRISREEDRGRLAQQMRRVLEGEACPPLEHWILHKDGLARWVRNTPVPLRRDDGRREEFDGLLSDITKQKGAELLLRIQCGVTLDLAEAATVEEGMERMLRCICETFSPYWSLGAYWSLDAAGHRLCCQAVWHGPREELVRFAEESRKICFAEGTGLPGKVWAEGTTFSLTDLSQFPECPRAACAGRAGLRAACAFPVRAGGGLVGIIELLSREAHSPDMYMVQVLTSVGTQIGQFVERKRAEVALAAEHHLLRAVIDTLPVYIYVKDRAGRFLLNNRAHLEVLGATQWEEVLGQTDFDFWPEELAGRYRADEEKILATGEPLLDREEPVLTPEGKQQWVLTTKVPFRNAQGEVVGLVGASRDITERKEAERTLKRAYSELAQKEEALRRALAELNRSHEELKATQLQLMHAAKLESLGTLAAGVAHEVKNPLQTLLTGVEYLSSNLGTNATLQQVCGDMTEAVVRANNIVRELLQLSAATEFTLQEEDLNALIEQSLVLIRNETLAAKINVVRRLDPNLTPVRIDRAKMQQVFINLFLNALQSMSEGGTLTITTRGDGSGAVDYGMPLPRSEFREGRRLVVVEVLDEGKGIPEEHLSRIFDPFFTTKQPGGGTGLGLPIVKKIVDLHGGAVAIRNAPGGGVLVTLVLAGVE